ncbi:adenylosuccinate synthetase [Candidatus Pacearchaeota archaeon]|nr:adenylosuccinate synthetase [Candidatus Pacearchaeota archaeon]
MISKKPIRRAFVGLQWGDEGKGKVVDEAAAEARDLNDGHKTIVVRTQGGPNAGHTIKTINSQGTPVTFITHAAPSGLPSNVDIAIGPHVAFSPKHFLKEINEARDLFNYNGRIMISERVGILLDYHRLIDEIRENNISTSVGSTKNGVGPFYEDVARRTTRITFADYVSSKFPDRLREVMEIKKSEIESALVKNNISFKDCLDKILAAHESLRHQLASYGERLEYRLNEYLEDGNHIIIEGAQGSGLDVDMGTIPDQTSSHLLAPHAFPGLGLSRSDFEIYGVEKIYPTRVGKGEMPTIDIKNFGKTVQREAREIGATTGRPRRVGYPDWVFVKHTARLNDCDGIILTRVDDVQNHELQVCVAYCFPDGNILNEVPLYLQGVTPFYANETFNWNLWNNLDETGIKMARKKYVEKGKFALPSNLREFISEHDNYVGCPIKGVSIGPYRGDTITKGF